MLKKKMFLNSAKKGEIVEYGKRRIRIINHPQDEFSVMVVKDEEYGFSFTLNPATVVRRLEKQ